MTWAKWGKTQQISTRPKLPTGKDIYAECDANPLIYNRNKDTNKTLGNKIRATQIAKERK